MTKDENLLRNTQQSQPNESPQELPASLVELLTAQAQATISQAQSIAAQTQALQNLTQSIDYLIGQNQQMLEVLLSMHDAQKADDSQQDAHL